MSGLETELLLQFCEITGTDPDIAQEYLTVSNNELENAISLFMENDGARLGQTNQSSNSTTQSNSHASGSNVRDPIPARRTRLLDNSDVESIEDDSIMINDDDDDDDDYIDEDWTNIESSTSANINSNTNNSSSRNTRSQNTTAAWTNIANYEPITPSNNSISSTGLSSTISSANGSSNRFEDLFKPPIDIMYSAPNFDAARSAAKAKGKWLMISIIDVLNFQSQTMNRDLFKDNNVKNAITKNFIFVQWTIDSQAGQQHRSYYPFEECPYTAIIDPLTGERSKMWLSTILPAQFLIDLSIFLDNNGVNPLEGPEETQSSNKSEQQKKKKYLTEEEELALAIQESLQSKDSSLNEIITLDNDEDDDQDDAGKNNAITEIIESDSISNIKGNLNVEPTDASITARIQIRSPDGERKVRKFNKQDKIKVIFEYVKADFVACQDINDFDILNFRDSLANKLNYTIEEEKLSGSSLTIAIP